MDRLKTFAKYAIWLILFWIFSDILIHVGLNTTYKNMSQKGTTPQGIEIVQMQSTAVNGRIKLNIKNTDFKGKYLKINLYSSYDNLLGTQYLEIGNVTESTSKTLETYFKIPEVKSYDISVVDEKGESSEGFMDTALSAMTILIATIKLLIL